MAEGIRKRHSKGCSAREGGRCNCKAGWEVSILPPIWSAGWPYATPVLSPCFWQRSFPDPSALPGEDALRIVLGKMAREGRQGLPPAYTAYRGLRSDSDGRRTGGKISSRQGAKARYPATEVARRLPGVHCRSARRNRRRAMSILSFFPQEPRFPAYMSWSIRPQRGYAR